MAESLLQVTQYDLQVQLFKVLAHPARLAILDLLRDGEHCVCHMETYLGQRQAYISQQLSVLREAGLIQDRREGWNIFYSVPDNRIFSLMDNFRQFSGQDEKIQQPVLECSCPQCQKKTSTN